MDVIFSMDNISIFWFRRDLRLEDNVGLFHALSEESSVLPIFIFDSDIIDELPSDDPRVQFIYQNLQKINTLLKEYNSGLKVYKGKPLNVWKEILEEYDVSEVFTNRDYEPYALQRDAEIADLLKSNDVEFNSYKDQVIYEKDEVTKDDGLPYTVYTPFKNKWLSHFNPEQHLPVASESLTNFYKWDSQFPSQSDLEFESSDRKVKPFTLREVENYEELRNFPATDGTSYLSPHLRFGTIGIRQLVASVRTKSDVFLSELIWREFFMQILHHFPRVLTENFKTKYDGIEWRNNKEEFEKWCNGETGYPMVDAGMRELNSTGYMHNRVRMVVASFLCKHLLIDWRWGEAYFAKKLLDYEASSNNGNWQWAAGTGCDASPYFRVFNPHQQLKKFDKDLDYVRKWVPEYFSFGYVPEVVEHKFARERCLERYKAGINA